MRDLINADPREPDACFLAGTCFWALPVLIVAVPCYAIGALLYWFWRACLRATRRATT